MGGASVAGHPAVQPALHVHSDTLYCTVQAYNAWLDWSTTALRSMLPFSAVHVGRMCSPTLNI